MHQSAQKPSGTPRPGEPRHESGGVLLLVAATGATAAVAVLARLASHLL